MATTTLEAPVKHWTPPNDAHIRLMRAMEMETPMTGIEMRLRRNLADWMRQGRAGTMTEEMMLGAWEEKYAEATLTAPGRTRLVIHHVHPHIAGRAHCNPTVLLDMDSLLTVKPTDGSYCQRCREREWWK